ncbi:hypothetical protein BASA83_013716 [Batrachochytrium salamandrivorans]|nr:hypothetical protein BASA83_013716 [Batrachochytrium salamandrivorans]
MTSHDQKYLERRPISHHQIVEKCSHSSSSFFHWFCQYPTSGIINTSDQVLTATFWFPPLVIEVNSQRSKGARQEEQVELAVGMSPRGRSVELAFWASSDIILEVLLHVGPPERRE